MVRDGSNLPFWITSVDSKAGMNLITLLFLNYESQRYRTYNIQRDEKIQRFFNGFANCLGEEEAWTRSLGIKPRKPSGRN